MEELLSHPEFQKLTPEFVYSVVLSLLQLVFFLLLANSIRKVLQLVSQENRMIIPSHAFFIIIPLFNIYWNFMLVRHLKDSLNNEFFDRKVPVELNPTQKEGYLFAWSFLLCNIPLPYYFNYIALFFNIISIILYWVKTKEYNKLLKDTASLIPNKDEEKSEN